MNYLEKSCEELDATVFSSDMMFDPEQYAMFKRYLARWNRAVEGHEKAEAMENATPPAAQQKPLTQRSDGMPQSKTERQLRRMLCVQRHGAGVYMDDGEASFGGDKYCRSIDYMRESADAIELAWRDAGIKKLAAAQPEQEPVADGNKVICPACCHQFRAIPTAVQTLMLNAGFEPPFVTPPTAQRKWVGLTDDEFLEACQLAECGNYLVAFQRIQITLKEKNT